MPLRLTVHLLLARIGNQIVVAAESTRLVDKVQDGLPTSIADKVTAVYDKCFIKLCPYWPQPLKQISATDSEIYTTTSGENYFYLDGIEALTVRVNKVGTANLLAVVDAVRAELDRIRAEPGSEALSIHVYRDSSVDVRRGLAQLRNAGLFGGLLAITAVLLFLRRIRTTLLVAIAIPVSVIGTFVLMYFLRQANLSEITLNVVSLAGLMLALGMLLMVRAAD